LEADLFLLRQEGRNRTRIGANAVAYARGYGDGARMKSGFLFFLMRASPATLMLRKKINMRMANG
jgi:hypothetical protein